MTAPAAQRARLPGTVSMALTAAMFLVIATFAMTARQAPPPSIAEFAPQAQKQITAEQAEQGAQGGDGPGGAGGGGADDAATTTTSTTVPLGGDDAAVDVPRVRRCVGAPPRQTEDPQSPPCVAYWEGDNGGATWRGVTATEIKVAYPDNGEHDPKIAAALFAYFNKRYEFYGRRLTQVPLAYSGNGGVANPAMQRNDAIRADEELGAFASTTYNCCEGLQSVYYDELARRQIVSAGGGGLSTTSLATEEHLAKQAPYEWQYMPAFDTSQRNSAEVVCKNLKKTPPRAARPSNPTEQLPPERVFGIMRERVSGTNSPPNIDVFKKAVEECGVEIKAMTEYYGDADTQNAITRLQSEKVTTVVCFCDAYSASVSIVPTAETSRYYPEWFFPAFHETGVDGAFKSWSPSQARAVFGVNPRNKTIRTADRPWWNAVKEVDPSLAPAYTIENLYQSLLVLASMIQMAGPELTPANIEKGLFKARFPNPGAGGPPYYQATVGFGPGSRAMTQDYALIWWDPEADSPDSGTGGAFCSVDLGARYRRGSWPAGERPFFTSRPCR